MGSGEQEEGSGCRSLQREAGMKGPRGRGGAGDGEEPGEDWDEESEAWRATHVRRPPSSAIPE